MSDRADKKRENSWAAEHLRELAERVALEDGTHRSRAYHRAAETVEQLRGPIRDLYQRDGRRGLEELTGIGPHIASTLCELLESGTLRRLERLREKTPVDVMSLLEVDGVGPKTVKLLWEKLGVRTLDDLERALDEHRVQGLPGFGEKREERLRQALHLRRRASKRTPLARVEPIAERLRAVVAGDPRVSQCAIAGSIRRRATTIGDIDLVAASEEPEGVAETFLRNPEVEYAYSSGPHRVSVRLAAGVDLDLRIVTRESYGSALLYFTGSRAHTVALRRLALAEGFHLNEYGLFRGSERVAGETEEEIYEALSLPYLPPESRSGEDEIRNALRRAATS